MTFHKIFYKFSGLSTLKDLLFQFEFQFIFFSTVIPKYSASISNGRITRFMEGIFKYSSFLFLVNGTKIILWELMDMPSLYMFLKVIKRTFGNSSSDPLLITTSSSTSSPCNEVDMILFWNIAPIQLRIIFFNHVFMAISWMDTVYVQGYGHHQGCLKINFILLRGCLWVGQSICQTGRHTGGC